MNNLSKIFDALSDKIKHGDEEHQNWLRNEMNEFLKYQQLEPVPLSIPAASVSAAQSGNDMTVQEFYSGFNLDFLTEEEKQTIYTATELYTKGKLRVAALPSQPSGEAGDDELSQDLKQIAAFLHIEFEYYGNSDIPDDSKWLASIEECKIVVTAETKEKAIYEVLVSLAVHSKYNANPKAATAPVMHQGEGSKTQLAGMRKDMEMALQREMMYDKALRDLCHLKKWKDEHGKDSHYEQHQPEAWAYAFSVIEAFGAHPHYTPVSKYLSIDPTPASNQNEQEEQDLVAYTKWVQDNWIVGTTGFWRSQSDHRDQRTDEALVKEYLITKLK